MKRAVWATALAVVAVLSGALVLKVHSNECSSTNGSLDVLKAVLTAAQNGPHHFNDPTDVHNRLVVYRRQIAKIRAARCH